MLSTKLGSAPLSLSMSLEEHTHGIHIDTDWGEKVLFCCCIHTIYSFMVMISSSFFVMLMILMVSSFAFGFQPMFERTPHKSISNVKGFWVIFSTIRKMQIINILIDSHSPIKLWIKESEYGFYGIVFA